VCATVDGTYGVLVRIMFSPRILVSRRVQHEHCSLANVRQGVSDESQTPFFHWMFGVSGLQAEVKRANFKWHPTCKWGFPRYSVKN